MNTSLPKQTGHILYCKYTVQYIFLKSGYKLKRITDPLASILTIFHSTFNPNKSGIGGKPTTFVRNDFTP